MRENIRIMSVIAIIAGLALAWVAHGRGQAWRKLEAEGIEVAGKVVRSSVTVKTGKRAGTKYWIYVEFRPEPGSTPRTDGFEVRESFFNTLISGEQIVRPDVKVKYLPGDPETAMIPGGSIPQGGIIVVMMMLGIAGAGGVVFLISGLVGPKNTKKSLSNPAPGDITSFEINNLPADALDELEQWILEECEKRGIRCPFLNVGFVSDANRNSLPNSGDLQIDAESAQSERMLQLLREGIARFVPAHQQSALEIRRVGLE
jgi:hypothetical protein